MKKQVLFIQGGGEDGYEADKEMVESLKAGLGNSYELSYPELQSDETVSDFGWPAQMGKAIDESKGDLILAGHSLGASLILKYLSESTTKKTITAIFLLATPFWSGNEEWKKGLMLKPGFANKLPNDSPIFLYHCRDDEEVPFKHLQVYAQKIPQATIREIDTGGHTFNNHLKFVADDIMSL